MSADHAPPIALVGLSGTGKSSVARLLTQQSVRAWVDTDTLIVQRTGRAIADIFASDGEPHFRALETEALRAAIEQAHKQPQVIATGGGIVLSAANRTLLEQTYTVWLDAPTATLISRLEAHDEQRPLLSGDDPAGRLNALRTARGDLYRAVADLVIDTGELDAAAVAALVLASYQQRYPDSG